MLLWGSVCLIFFGRVSVTKDRDSIALSYSQTKCQGFPALLDLRSSMSNKSGEDMNYATSLFPYTLFLIACGIVHSHFLPLTTTMEGRNPSPRSIFTAL